MSCLTIGPFLQQLQLSLKYALRAVLEAFTFFVMTICSCICRFEVFRFSKPDSPGKGAHLDGEQPNNPAEALAALRATVAAIGNDFRDGDFDYPGQWINGEGVNWQRSTVPMWDAERGPSPLDAVQGQLGTCYFICSLAALTEDPKRVQQLYAGSNADGSAHGVLFFFRGKWTGVVVDNQFPFFANGNKPAACKSIAAESGKQSVMWPALFEKAWAKLHGRFYSGVEGGLPSFALHCLSGQPTRHMNLVEYSRDQVWEALLQASGDSSVICADIHSLPLLTSCLPFSCNSWFSKLAQCWLELGAPARLFYFFWRDAGRAIWLFVTLPFALLGGCFQYLSFWWNSCTTGLVETHAYSVLEAEAVPYLMCSNERLVKIRNPHGTGEWRRRWGDSSICWSINGDAAAKVKFQAADDGVFYMDLDDFVDYVSGISICNFGVPTRKGGSSQLTNVAAGGARALTQWSARFKLTEQMASFRLNVPASAEPVWASIGVVDCASSNGYRDGSNWALKVWCQDQDAEVGGSGETVFNESSCTELAWRPTATLATQGGVLLHPGKQYTLAVYCNGSMPVDCLLLTSTAHEQPVQVSL